MNNATVDHPIIDAANAVAQAINHMVDEVLQGLDGGTTGKQVMQL
jgi:hypothetical protein